MKLTIIAIIFLIIVFVMFYLVTFDFYAQAEEQLTDGQLTLKLSENMATFSHSYDTQVTAQVLPNMCNACMQEAGNDYDTRRQCFELFCK